MVIALLIFASLLAVSYAAFTTGVLCAGNRQLRLVFVRVLALLGLAALGGAWVSVLRAENLDAEADVTEEATAEEAAEIVVDAFGQIDDHFIDRYTSLDQLMAVAEPTADNIVETVVAEEEMKVGESEPTVIGCPDIHNLQFVDSVDETVIPVSIESVSPPVWVGASVINTAESSHWIAVESGPWLTDVEADTELHDVIFEAVANYVDDQVGRRGAARKIRLSTSDIEAFRVVQDRFADEYQSSLGPMQRKHAKLVFTPAFRSAIAARWQEHLVAHRLVRTGVGIAVVMGLLFVMLGIFKRLGSTVR